MVSVNRPRRTSSKKSPRDRRSLIACQRCRGLKKKCKPQEGRARCKRCESTGQVCRYISVSEDPAMHDASSSSSPRSTITLQSPEGSPEPSPPLTSNETFDIHHERQFPLELTPVSSIGHWIPTSDIPHDSSISPHDRYSPEPLTNSVGSSTLQQQSYSGSYSGSYNPPNYPPPSFQYPYINGTGIHNSPIVDAQSTPFAVRDTPIPNDEDMVNPSSSPDYRRTHFTQEPQQSVSPSASLQSYGGLDLTLPMPMPMPMNMAVSLPLSPNQPFSPSWYESPHSPLDSASSFNNFDSQFTPCSHCPSGYCLVHMAPYHAGSSSDSNTEGDDEDCTGS